MVNSSSLWVAFSPQALAILNDELVRAASCDFADRLKREGGAELAGKIDLAFQLALARSPTGKELAAAGEFIDKQFQARRSRDADAPEETIRRLALADFCQVVFGLNEFIYID